jgi:peptide/nickel transport system ATP-binding protein
MTETSTRSATEAAQLMATSRAVVLEADDLQIDFATPRGRVRALDSATLTVSARQVTAVVGESGSGKSTLGLAAGRLLAASADHVGGQLRIAGVPVLDCKPEALRSVRREVLGYVFQNPVAALDPTMRVRAQMERASLDHTDAGSIEQALLDVGLRDTPRVLRSYPHQLSGGMAQRVAIAMTLRRKPKLLIADEPTAAVDATLRSRILELLVERCRAQDCALMLLTHDLRAVASHATHVAVMYGGRVVEYGGSDEVLTNPVHPYTRALVNALPGDEQVGHRIAAIRGVPIVLGGPSTGCAFTARCPDAMGKCLDERPISGPVARLDGRVVCCHLVTADDGGDRTRLRPDLEQRPPQLPPARPDVTTRNVVTSVRDLAVTYVARRRGAEAVRALRGVSLDVSAYETLGVVGESGSGKTTLGQAMLGLLRPEHGQVLFDGFPVTGRGATNRLKGRLQVVLQNPDWSLNPSLQIWRSVAEPLVVTRSLSRGRRRAAVQEMLSLVGLDSSLAHRRPHELSGGQRQRVAIARAIITDPDLIVFDEAVTALDASVQTQILNLIRDLQAERGFAAVFISHDLAAVRYVSHQIAVLRDGELVETGPVERFYGRAEHPYTQQLLATLSTG